MVAAGPNRTVLLRSDGHAVYCGEPPENKGTQASVGGAHTVLLRSDGQALASGYNKDNAKFHHWMLDSSTPKFLRATTIQLFFEVMVLRRLVDTICTSSATFRLWNTA